MLRTSMQESIVCNMKLHLINKLNCNLPKGVNHNISTKGATSKGNISKRCMEEYPSSMLHKFFQVPYKSTW